MYTAPVTSASTPSGSHRRSREDAKRTEPWEQDTITNVWSTTKTMVALSALILADRGALDPDAPVARYWPEFATAGKERVLVRHLLSHTAGLPEFDPPDAVADLYDWPKATRRLVRQAPRWEPGTLAGYHSVTQGFLVGEVVRRVTGQSLATFFAERIAIPLGADFHLSPAAAKPAASGCCHRKAASAPGKSSTAAATRSWAGRCGTGWATGSSTPRAGGPAGAARSSWSTSTRA
jgi:CubicO group peptidase (beta-lactamase class C family)